MKTLAEQAIKIESLTEEHTASAVKLFVNSFCESEPITKHLNIKKEDYVPFATEVVKKAVKDRLSLAVLSHDKVIGLIIAEDLADPFQPSVAKYPMLRPVISLLEELSKPMLEGREFTKGKVMHTWIAAIDPQFRSTGLYTEVGITHVKLAAKKGFDFIYSDFTNDISEKIIRNFPVELCNKVALSSFEYRPFAGLEGSASAYITPLKPGVKVDSLEKCYTLSSKAAVKS